VAGLLLASWGVAVLRSLLAHNYHSSIRCGLIRRCCCLRSAITLGTGVLIRTRSRAAWFSSESSRKRLKMALAVLRSRSMPKIRRLRCDLPNCALAGIAYWRRFAGAKFPASSWRLIRVSVTTTYCPQALPSRARYPDQNRVPRFYISYLERVQRLRSKFRLRCVRSCPSVAAAVAMRSQSKDTNPARRAGS